jgi:hypothetical protein
MPHQLIHNHYVTCGTSTHENNYFVPKLIRLFQVYIWIQLRKVIYSELLQENYFMNYVLSSPAKDCLLAIKPDSRFPCKHYPNLDNFRTWSKEKLRSQILFKLFKLHLARIVEHLLENVTSLKKHSTDIAHSFHSHHNHHSTETINSVALRRGSGSCLCKLFRVMVFLTWN